MIVVEKNGAFEVGLELESWCCDPAGECTVTVPEGILVHILVTWLMAGLGDSLSRSLTSNLCFFGSKD